MPSEQHKAKLNFFPSVPLITKWLFIAFSCILIISILLGVAFELYFLFVIPLIILVVYQSIFDYTKIFYLLLLSIPFSVELDFSSSLSTDFPAEFLMIGLMGIFIIKLIENPQKIAASFLTHPISLLLLLHLGWIIFTTIHSNLFIVSLKYLLAKFWYIIVFFFLVADILRGQQALKIAFNTVFIPLLISIFYVWFWHAPEGFSFAYINKALRPIYRNHVDYACILVLFLPFVGLLLHRSKKFSAPWWWMLSSFIIFIAAIYLSYTRVAIISALVMPFCIYIIRWKLLKYTMLIGLLSVGFMIHFLIQKNQYLEYAPNFEKTITHYEFDDLLSATTKGEDLSTMERVYRWVAGLHMSKDETWTGFGPGNFYNFYKKYTVNSFVTYVSDNPEKSGIHNYFFMVLVEQGFIGFLLFLGFTIFTLYRGEQIYHQCQNPEIKALVMAILLSLIAINLILIINDMLETDKVGTFYFMNIALLINIDLYNQQNSQKQLIETP